MQQEVQVVLTLTVDAKLTKRDVENFINQMLNENPRHRWLIPSVKITSIKEEAEIYGNEPEVPVMYARKCDVTGRGMNAGFYCSNDIHQHYFSERDYLIAHLRKIAYCEDLDDADLLDRAFEAEEYCYTEWDPEQEALEQGYYYDEDGNEVEFRPIHKD